jgi:hypothetical protein
VDSIVEAYEYLTDAIKPLNNKARLAVMDQTNALSFTISYKLFDQQKKAWTFNSAQLLAKFGDLLLKMRQSPG